MLQPQIFRENRIEIMHDIMRMQPFASLVSMQEGDIVADHIPLIIHPELSTQGTLRGHIARSNPIGNKLDEKLEALVMFRGPHHYITPSWYPSKKEQGKVVPTWNYIVVHARGKIKFHQDADWILSHLTELTSRHESGRKEPWKVSDAPDDYIARQLRAITGIEIEITSLQGTWKVSQNKTIEDNQGVCAGLKAELSETAQAMAACVEGKRR
ncbi:FMN-binding negative transcriptional regulator [Neptunomonas antarctica]|uniref:Negative transcriptional regulator, PaiB family n=1 Tax=Neptunomonas antarctica TaxID=619304 RepID=A0A1N7K0L2_9GAMM|nr:FMN-binding negative transcriptional regulator [Neptunomonas antarctica]SIS55120.1 negative transcriptional regulator, PaiB family [Neptunomonas antarctica]